MHSQYTHRTIGFDLSMNASLHVRDCRLPTFLLDIFGRFGQFNFLALNKQWYGICCSSCTPAAGRFSVTTPPALVLLQKSQSHDTSGAELRQSPVVLCSCLTLCLLVLQDVNQKLVLSLDDSSNGLFGLGTTACTQVVGVDMIFSFFSCALAGRNVHALHPS